MLLNKEKLLEWLQKKVDSNRELREYYLKKGKLSEDGILIGDERISVCAFHNREMSFQDVINAIMNGLFEEDV